MIKVLHIDFYSGGQKDESPREIFTNSGIIKIYRVIEIKLEEEVFSKKRRKIFIFESTKGVFYKLTVSGDSFELEELKLNEKRT
ncbi:MAG: hypothetical protein ABIN61_02095 [candidate division WOR-3 bacterium]